METFTNIFNTIAANFPVYFMVFTSFVGSFALLATITKNESDNKIADFLLKVVNVFGANFGKAKNSSSSSTPPAPPA